jgi:hypothetical protein
MISARDPTRTVDLLAIEFVLFTTAIGAAGGYPSAPGVMPQGKGLEPRVDAKQGAPLRSLHDKTCLAD